MANPKQVVITGVSRGLGRVMAQGFAALGHRVSGCARSADAIDSLGEELNSPHRFEVVDVSNPGAVDKWAKSVLSDSGPPDLLINSAALINSSAPLWEVSAEEFSTVIDVNLKGVANVIRSFLPSMLEARQGVIVNFSSGWGRSTSPDVAPYCATKWGIEGMTKALAQELPTGLAAVAFNPGIIDTEMLRSCFGGGASHYPNPEEWAQSAVPFLDALGPSANGTSLTCPGH